MIGVVLVLLLTLTDSTYHYDVSIVDFEQGSDDTSKTEFRFRNWDYKPKISLDTGFL